MVKKRAGKKNRKVSKKNKNLIEREIDSIEEDIEDVENWVIERRKFFKKLAWVIGFIALLLILSHFYLRVRGVGI